jgi:ElaB/YqjD/DUF883 family membrane-anchored ribosome-binding protein
MADDKKPAPKAKAAAKPAAKAKTVKPTKMVAETSSPGTGASAAETLKATATKLSQQAADKARDYVAEGKSRAGGALDEVSRLMGEAAGTVDEKLGPDYGKYARSAADTLSGWSEQIKGKELEDLLGDARDFVKKSPVVAIGVAAALGFVVARLVRAGISADNDA